MRQTLLDIRLAQEKGESSPNELAEIIERRLAAVRDRTGYLGQLGSYLAATLAGVIPDPEEYD